MSNFSSDLALFREMATQLQHIFAELTELRKMIMKLKESRRALERTQVLSFEQWVHEMTVTYGHPINRDAESTKRDYSAYEERTIRQREEINAQMERARSEIKSMIERLHQQVAKFKNEDARMDDRLRTLSHSVTRAKEEIEKSPSQLSLETLGNIERELRDHRWLQDQM